MVEQLACVSSAENITGNERSWPLIAEFLDYLRQAGMAEGGLQDFPCAVSDQIGLRLAGWGLASTDEKSVPLFHRFTGDHPPHGDDVHPLSLRQVEDLLFERGIDICHETVRFWWNPFGPMFAAEIRKRRVQSHS